MHSPSSIFLLFIFGFGALVPGQLQEELTKLPVLWKHYQIHKNQAVETTFLQYFKLHYSDDFATHRTAHDHSRLPMKSSDKHLHAPTPVDLPELVSLRFHLLPAANKAPFFTTQTYPFLHLHDIWQPPKSC